MTSASLIARAGRSTVASLFVDRVRAAPGAIAAQQGDRQLTYAALNERTNRTASLLLANGLSAGDRVAVLAENRLEYLELKLAAAKLGVIVACQNWRLAPAELQHCLDLVEPKLILVSPRHAGLLAQVDTHGLPVLAYGDAFEAALSAQPAEEPAVDIGPEAGLVILYTSGTTGLPKGAMVSHRAEVARSLVLHVDLPIRPGDTFVAWSPLYHMGASDQALSTLMTGGKVAVVDGFDLPELVRLIEAETIGWLILMPGMIEQMIAALRRAGVRPRGVRVCGAMADLVPAHQLAEVTRLLGAPYVNTFGATETGTPPCTGALLPAGEVPAALAKRRSSFCELRLVDPDGSEVPDGTPGEMAVRGPTLFSGYWRAEEANARDFRGGWFHMGDVFVRRPEGTYDFVDRAKYMIKSGGENIYPAEIERVLLLDEQVADAAVVRRRDDRWGEVPVAFVARKGPGLTAETLYGRCRAALAGYKQPKDIRFIPLEAFPRSATGKIQRHEMEAWLRTGEVPEEA